METKLDHLTSAHPPPPSNGGNHGQAPLEYEGILMIQGFNEKLNSSIEAEAFSSLLDLDLGERGQ
jgi:hypothetical protein